MTTMIRPKGIWPLTFALALLGTSACGGESSSADAPSDGTGGSSEGTGGSNDGTGGSSEGTGGSSEGTGGSSEGTGGSNDGTGGTPGDSECPSGCLIDGSCVAADEEHPDDPCLLCLPDVSAMGWSPNEMCCDVEPTTLGCNDDGNVVGLNACGDVVTEVVEACSELENRACYEGACACEPGWIGGDCERAVFHVRTDGDDEASGRTWDEALATVGAALAAAAEATAGGTPAEIWVAAGTYVPPSNTDDPRAATFRLVPGVSLYGGFAGSESARDERDFAGNVTLLSGDIGAEDDRSDNVYHVVTGADGATLDGFTVMGGNADGSGDAEYGAGMYNVEVAVTVANCIFSRNSAAGRGGGMYNGYSANVVVIGSAFESTATFGGGMYNDNSSNVIVAGSQFNRNNALRGGGMHNSGATVTVGNSAFTGNMAGEGGGVRNSQSTITVSNSVFTGNTAVMDGGGVDNVASTITITGSQFTQNSANRSGDNMYLGGSVSVANSILSASTGESVALRGAASVHLSHSIVEGGCPEDATCTAVIDADPLFVDSESGDFRLRPGSPAIDAGSNEALPADVLDLDGDGDTEEPWPLDFAGGPRVIGPRVDIGLYEASCEDTPGVQSGIGAECAPVSCAALLADQPESESGEYWLDPGDGPPFRAGCDMSDPEGPWTLLFQQGPDFDRSVAGDATSACTYRVCTSAAYDRLPLGDDLRFDADNDLMSGEGFLVRTTVSGIDASLVGKTLFEVLADVEVPYYVEQDDNGNVHNEFREGYACAASGDDVALPFGDWRSLVCGSSVVVFNDPSGCQGSDVVHAIGGDLSRTTLWNQCAGWPETVLYGEPAAQVFPNYYRIWTR